MTTNTKVRQMSYQDFINSKKHLIGDFGFKNVWMPDCAFDFQKEIISRGTRKGRKGLFVDTGLGKTLIQLAIAYNIVKKTNKRVLISTPIAVAFQFIKEANNLLGIDDIEYSRDGKFTKKIVLCNYERLHYFDPNDFDGYVCDESSILKNFDGKTKTQITSFMKKIKYRYLSTATPSPNDYIELGTSSEALGYMGYMDMLGKFFSNNQNTSDSNNRNVGNKFYLKPHAENDFFRWINQWALMVKMPSDLGFKNDKYILPELITNTHTVKNQSLIDVNGQVQMFTPIARTLSEVRHEQKQTFKERCERAYQLSNGKNSVYWVNFNEESRLIKELDPDAYEIKGGMSIEKKEELLIAFAEGQIDRLITKAKITGMGLNWQHCNHSTVFPTWSYEQYYQLIRRFWRFGQKRDVTIDLVISDGQTRVIQALKEKTEKAIELYEQLTKNVNGSFTNNVKEFNKQIQKPTFV